MNICNNILNQGSSNSRILPPLFQPNPNHSIEQILAKLCIAAESGIDKLGNMSARHEKRIRVTIMECLFDLKQAQGKSVEFICQKAINYFTTRRNTSETRLRVSLLLLATIEMFANIRTRRTRNQNTASFQTRTPSLNCQLSAPKQKTHRVPSFQTDWNYDNAVKIGETLEGLPIQTTAPKDTPPN